MGPIEVAAYLDDIVHPVLACFGDQDARVRYYACESMYNIAKVAKGEILLYFNELFDILCKLSADDDSSVRTGAELLDRLIKDIVAEKAATYVSIISSGPTKIIPAQIESDDPTKPVMANEPPQIERSNSQLIANKMADSGSNSMIIKQDNFDNMQDSTDNIHNTNAGTDEAIDQNGNNNEIPNNTSINGNDQVNDPMGKSAEDNENFHDLPKKQYAFSLPKFIPILADRMYTKEHRARTFLIGWIGLLDSIPDLELVAYLPAFLDGLLQFLDDSDESVRNSTSAILDIFLEEIRKITVTKNLAKQHQLAKKKAQNKTKKESEKIPEQNDQKPDDSQFLIDTQDPSKSVNLPPASQTRPTNTPQHFPKGYTAPTKTSSSTSLANSIKTNNKTQDTKDSVISPISTSSPQSPTTAVSKEIAPKINSTSSSNAVNGEDTPSFAKDSITTETHNLAPPMSIATSVEPTIGTSLKTVTSTNIVGNDQSHANPESAVSALENVELNLSTGLETSVENMEIQDSQNDQTPEDNADSASADIDDNQVKNEEDEDDDEMTEDGFYIPGQDVYIDFEKIVEILISQLESPVQAVHIMVLKWIEAFLEIFPASILPYEPRFLSILLPIMAYDDDDLKKIAEKVNQKLLNLIMSLPDVDPYATPNNDDKAKANNKDSAIESTTSESPSDDDDDTEPSLTELVLNKLDYPAMVNTLTLHFLDENEETRVAAFDWLIQLHRKAPKKILAINDGTFPVLLKTLSDPSEQVVTRDLRLLAQISYRSDDEYFMFFMVNLLNLFSTDRRLLETRGNLIIRQLCISLKPERIYGALADILAKEEEDLEFASLMVQYLSNILLTAPELLPLRVRLRNLNTKEGVSFFTALFKSWCHNPPAVLTLCLLTQAYEHSFILLQTIVDFEITIPLLIQIDKLVQLLESPVFTHLRLQLLEPEKYPFLYKCLYGILMLLPQSSAFVTLKNRLNSVSSIGYLHAPPPHFYQRSGSNSGTGSATGSSVGGPGQITSKGSGRMSMISSLSDVKWPELIKRFREVQQKHQEARNKASILNNNQFLSYDLDSAALNSGNGSMSSPISRMKDRVGFIRGNASNSTITANSLSSTAASSVYNKSGRATPSGGGVTMATARSGDVARRYLNPLTVDNKNTQYGNGNNNSTTGTRTSTAKPKQYGRHQVNR